MKSYHRCPNSRCGNSNSGDRIMVCDNCDTIYCDDCGKEKGAFLKTINCPKCGHNGSETLGEIE